MPWSEAALLLKLKPRLKGICHKYYQGKEKSFIELLFTHLLLRVERRSTIITTNLFFERWDEIFLRMAGKARLITESLFRQFKGRKTGNIVYIIDFFYKKWCTFWPKYGVLFSWNMQLFSWVIFNYLPNDFGICFLLWRFLMALSSSLR